ncbi:hypothetical protein P8452_71049 [Trifolium repens]|nr:hypothetical protein P8452_71049 [Trifolium repens]
MRSVSIKQERFTKRQSMEVHWAWNVDTEQESRRQKVYKLQYSFLSEWSLGRSAVKYFKRLHLLTIALYLRAHMPKPPQITPWIMIAS